MSLEQEEPEETRPAYLNRELLDPAALGLKPVFLTGEPVDPVWIPPDMHERNWNKAGGDYDKYLELLKDEGVI
jgi:hypothetical protein